MAKSSVHIEPVLAGLDKMLAAKEPVARAMGAAMGNVVRDEAKVRAPVLKPGNEGTDGQRAGLLRDSIYNAFDKRRLALAPNSFRYTVSWNSTRAPHGHLLEFGHQMPYEAARNAEGLWYTPIAISKKRGRQVGFSLEGDGFFVAASPFLGPAFDATRSSLGAVARDAGTAKMREVMG